MRTDHVYRMKSCALFLFLTFFLGLSGCFNTPISWTSANQSQSTISANAVIVKISGDNQSGAAGATLPLPLVVQVNSASGSPLASTPVSFNGQTVITNLLGQAQMNWTLAPCSLCAAYSSFPVSIQGTTISTSFSATITPLAMLVQPLYANAPNWNDYVTRNGQAACTGSETVTGNSPSPCIHGGEKRRVIVSGETSCNGLSASDQLGVFVWSCGMVSNQVVFVSSFAPGKGLKDLINATGTGFQLNSVTVTKSGYSSVATASSVWWTNPVVPTNAIGSTALLNANSTIYAVINSETASHGYTIDGSKTALVTLPGVTISGGAGVSNCISSEYPCLVLVNGTKFNWVEGRFNGPSGNAADTAVYVYGSVYTRIHGLIESTSGEGVQAYLSNYTFIDQSKLMNNNRGLDFNNSSYGIVLQTFSGNNGNEAFFASASNYLVLSQLYASSSGYGISIFNSTSPTVTDFTGANISSAYGAIYLSGVISPTVNQVYTENSEYGLYLFNTGNGYLSQIAISQSFNAIELNSSNGDLFQGNLLLNAFNSNCSITSSSVNLVSPCYAQNAANYNIISSESLTSETLGVVSDTSQEVLLDEPFSSITNWVDFDFLTRSWGNYDTGSYGSNSNNTVTTAGQCSAGNCAVWDLALSASARLIRNTSGDGVDQNSTFAANLPCPAAADGDQNLTNSSTTYLKNAVEIIGTGGNDNGLCEAGETCLYTPNFGAYQGQGPAYLCTFAPNGGVNGVTMYGNLVNGR